MKRFATMMGALLLMPTLALANSDMVSISELRQQAEAVGRWTQTYETPNGKVSVDIPIIVPEVENVPILQVSAVMGKTLRKKRDCSNPSIRRMRARVFSMMTLIFFPN